MEVSSAFSSADRQWRPTGAPPVFACFVSFSVNCVLRAAAAAPASVFFGASRSAVILFGVPLPVQLSSRKWVGVMSCQYAFTRQHQPRPPQSRARRTPPRRVKPHSLTLSASRRLDHRRRARAFGTPPRRRKVRGSSPPAPQIPACALGADVSITLRLSRPPTGRHGVAPLRRPGGDIAIMEKTLSVQLLGHVTLPPSVESPCPDRPHRPKPRGTGGQTAAFRIPIRPSPRTKLPPLSMKISCLCPSSLTFQPSHVSLSRSAGTCA